MDKPDLVETVNLGHEAFLNKLKPLKASDSSFPYWLSSAALNLCVTIGNDKLQGKLKHVDDLVKVVQEGFEQMKDLLHDLSEEEQSHMAYCQGHFTEIYEINADKSKTDYVKTQPRYELRSEGSDRRLKSENKQEIATTLNDGKKTDSKRQLNVSSASLRPPVKRKADKISMACF